MHTYTPLPKSRPLHLLVPEFLGVQTHIPRHQTSLPAAAPLERLGIHDAVAPLRGLHQLRVLLLEDGEVALGVPVPDGVGGEDEIHFLQGALVRFRVEGPHDDDGGDVDGAEEVEGLFAEFGEYGGEEEDLEWGMFSLDGWICLFLFVISSFFFLKAERGKRKTYRPSVAYGPSHNTPCITSRTHFEWENLGRV